MPSSRMTSTTSGWTRVPGSATEPADSLVWRPSAARSNSAWLICDRPALCRQTNSTLAIARDLLRAIRWCGASFCASSNELVGEHPGARAEDRRGDVDPEVMPGPGDESGAEGACGV